LKGATSCHDGFGRVLESWKGDLRWPAQGDCVVEAPYKQIFGGRSKREHRDPKKDSVPQKNEKAGKCPMVTRPWGTWAEVAKNLQTNITLNEEVQGGGPLGRGGDNSYEKIAEPGRSKVPFV